MKSIRVKASIKNTANVLSFIDEQLEEAGCPAETRLQIELAVDELFANISKYAYGPDDGMAEIGIEIIGEPHIVCVKLADSGVKYNPLEKEDPDISLPRRKRPVGGMGIYLAKQNMDDIRYEYTDGKNILTLEKNL
jgi:anti-sigma regulatory factor (Ser/Thr protein kinase)